jgi:hypothetical protein
MESNHRYYWRRASEELQAAARAVTPAAQQRRRQLAESYFRKLCDLPTRQEAELGSLPRDYREELARGLLTLGALRPEWPIERAHATPAFAE